MITVSRSIHRAPKEVEEMTTALCIPACPEVREPAAIPHRPGWRLANARILSPVVSVHEEADGRSPLVATLAAGDEARLVSAIGENGQRWAAIKLPGAREGYVPGGTRVHRYRWVRLWQAEVTARDQPSPASRAAKRYTERAEFRIIDTVEGDRGPWARIRDFSGAEGFIPGGTRVRLVADGRE